MPRYSKKKYTRCVEIILVSAAASILEDEEQAKRYYGEVVKGLKLKTEADYLGYVADLDELPEFLDGTHIRECWQDAFSDVEAYLRTEGTNPFIEMASRHQNPSGYEPKPSQLPLFN